jgi:hypothetical protein
MYVSCLIFDLYLTICHLDGASGPRTTMLPVIDFWLNASYLLPSRLVRQFCFSVIYIILNSHH